MLNNNEQKIALEIAHNSIKAVFDSSSQIENKAISLPKVFQEKLGVFVTIYQSGELRGCIGCLTSQSPLAQSIKEMAYAAAFSDPRFLPLAEDELDKIKIEISVLSPLKQIKDIAEIKLGEHGVYLQNGMQSGVFLPQVAIKAGWNKQEMLENLCSHKAGLSRDCFLSPQTKLYTFSSQVIE